MAATPFHQFRAALTAAAAPALYRAGRRRPPCSHVCQQQQQQARWLSYTTAARAAAAGAAAPIESVSDTDDLIDTLLTVGTKPAWIFFDIDETCKC